MGRYSETTLVMVDDDENEILLTKTLLQKNGIINKFVSEREPENLMNKLDNLEADGCDPSGFMVLLDINMPEINGFEVLESIRKHAKRKSIPVIMLTSSDDASDIFESMETGSDGYLVKPFSGAEFFAAVENIPTVMKSIVQQQSA